MTNNRIFNLVRRGVTLALTVGLAAVGHAGHATGYAGYDDTYGYSLNTTSGVFSASTLGDTAAGDFVSVAPASTTGSALWAQKQFVNALGGNVVTYNFPTYAGNASQAVTGAGAGKFGDSDFNLTVGSGWTTALVTDTFTSNPYKNGEPIQTAGSPPSLNSDTSPAYYTGSDNTYLLLKPGTPGSDTVTLISSAPVSAIGFFEFGLGDSGGSIITTLNGGATVSTVKGSDDIGVATATTGYNAQSQMGGEAFYAVTSSIPFTTMTLSDPASGDEFAISQIDYSLTTPEPSTVASFLVAGVLLGGLLIGKRRRAAHSA